MKDQLSGKLMATIVAISSAVGLGNLWKFPVLTGENGGAAFVLIYVLSSLIVGIPLLMAEYIIGRHTKTNLWDVYTSLKASKYWRFLSGISLLANFMMTTFYTVIVGWVYIYFFKAIKGDFSNPTLENLQGQFEQVTTGGISFIAQSLLLIVIIFIIYKGVSNGIERTVRILAPIFLVLLFAVFLNSLRLDGFGQAMDFLFSFDASAITPSVIISALGLAFFKLSIGTASMIMYGSYFTKETNIPKTAATVAVADVGVSLLAGMALFPVVFTFGLSPEAGPSLLFNTVPLAFSSLPLGNLLTIAFFGLAAIVGTMAAVALINVQFVVIKDKLKGSTLVKAIGLLLFSLTVSYLTMFPFSVFGEVVIGGKTLNDVFDYVSSNYLLPIAGVLIALFVGFVLRKEVIQTEVGNSRMIKVWFFLIRYVVPIIIIIVFINGIL